LAVTSGKYQQQKSDNTRSLLIATAKKLFQARGFPSVGVRDISGAANVTTGTFYYYFKSKDEIFEEIHNINCPDIDDIIFNDSADESAREKLENYFVQHLAAQVLRDGKDYSIHRMFRARTPLPATPMWKMVCRLVDNARERGELSTQEETSDVTRYLLSIYHGLVYDWSISQEDIDLRGDVRKYIVFALNSLK